MTPAEQPAGWPRRESADHHEELCPACEVPLAGSPVVRTFEGEGYHEICWDPPRRPPAEEVASFWEGCLRIGDPSEETLGDRWDAARYLATRGLLFGIRDSVRVLPRGADCPPWARYGSRCWTETGHRLIVPVYDHAGRLALVRGWRWEPDDSPKRLAAAGCSVRGLVVAGGLGLQMLRGELPEWQCRARVLIAEGEPDALAATIRWPDQCVLGIVPGCWCPELAARIPSGATIVIRTDQDEAGERYAQQIGESLRGRCDVRRDRGEAICG